MKSYLLSRKILCLVAFIFSSVVAMAQTPFYKLAATSLLEGCAAGTDSVTFAVYPITNIWSATTTTPWLHLTTNNMTGTGGTNVIFTFDTNSGPTRTGTLTIQGLNVTVTQAGSNYVAANPIITLFTNSVAKTLFVSMAVDSSGNVYVGNRLDQSNNLIKWSPSTAQTNVLLTNLIDFSCLTLDNSQNLMFLTQIYEDHGYWNLWRYSLSTGEVTNLLETTLSNPFCMFMDSSNNVYIADYGTSAIREWNGSGNFYTLTALDIDSEGVEIDPMGVIVDILGNIFVANFESAECAYKWNPNYSYYPWNINPQGVPPRYIYEPTNYSTVFDNRGYANSITVDGSGNVYYANGDLRKWNAASQTVSTIAQGVAPLSIVLDSADNIYFVNASNGYVTEIPHAYVDTSPKFESAAAGHDMLNPVIPSTSNLKGVFAPTSDSSWLTITSTASDWIYFSFTANTNVARTAHINLLGHSIPITQQGVTPPLLTGLKYMGNGVCQFSFTNVPGKSFRVVSSTDLAVPITNWTVVGHATNISGTTFQFTTKPDTSDAAVFYGILWP